MKKLLLTLSAPIIALSPVVAVVACGKESTVDKDTSAIRGYLNKISAATIEKDLSGITSGTEYNASQFKVDIEKAIKDQISANVSGKTWGTGDEINVFDGIKYEFNWKASSGQAITITVKAIKNGKSSSKNVVITGTVAETPDAEQQLVNTEIGKVGSTGSTSVDISSLSTANAEISDTTMVSNIKTAITGVTNWDVVNWSFKVKTVFNATSKAVVIEVKATHKDAPAKTATKEVTITSSFSTQTPQEVMKDQLTTKLGDSQTTKNAKTISQLEAIVSSTSSQAQDFDSTAITNLGLNITISNQGSLSLKYTLIESTAPLGDNSGVYTLTITISNGTVADNQTATTSLTSKDTPNQVDVDALHTVISALFTSNTIVSDKAWAESGTDLADGLENVSPNTAKEDSEALTEISKLFVFENPKDWPSDLNSVGITFAIARGKDDQDALLQNWVVTLTFKKGTATKNYTLTVTPKP